MIPCECCCDDKKVRDLEKKVNKAVYSVAVNGEIIYPTDGVGNVNLGDIGGSTDARDIKMPDGTSVAVNIDDLNTAVKDAVSEVVPTPVTDGINLNETDGNGTVSRMLIRADDTLKFDGLNVGISEATDARITQAQADATTAGTKADDAQADADTAQATANTAKTTADGALTAANKAVINLNTSTEITDDYLKYALNEAHNNGVTGKTSLFAVDRGDLNMMNVADTFPVLQLSDDVKTKINGAISAIGASVVDTALEMNIDKADGTTATEQLFSIGDGLEWVEGVLKATGGSGVTASYHANATNFDDAKVGDILILINAVIPGKYYYPDTLTIKSGLYGSYVSARSVGPSASIQHSITGIFVCVSSTSTSKNFNGYAMPTTPSYSTTASMSVTHEGTTESVSVPINALPIANKASIVYYQGIRIVDSVQFEYAIEGIHDKYVSDGTTTISSLSYYLISL